MSNPSITLRLGELVNAKPALERLVQLKFSITTSYKLARRLRIINDALMTFDAKQGELVKELGTPVDGEADKIQIRPIPLSMLQEARDLAAKLRRAVILKSNHDENASPNTETTKVEVVADSPEALAIKAEAKVLRLEREAAAWVEFSARRNELMMIEETLSFDPIKISELQAPESSHCSKCNRSPNDISIEDMMLLLPLLAEEAT